MPADCHQACGKPAIDWSDEAARREFLSGIVSDAKLLLGMADGGGEQVCQAAKLLSALLLQDVEQSQPDEGGGTSSIKEGVTKGRIPSVTDPDQRHGRKSKSKRFTGHKASVTCDVESQIITSVAVLPGDAPDSQGALDQVKPGKASAAEHRLPGGGGAWRLRIRRRRYPPGCPSRA